MREKNISVAPRMRPSPGIEPATFWCTGQCSNQLNHPIRTGQNLSPAFCVIFFLLFVCLFLEGGKGRRRRGRDINVWLPLTHPLLGAWPATQACALTGNLTGNPLGHRPVLNPLSYTSQGYFFFFVRITEGGATV